MHPQETAERVVLLGADGNAIGTELKASVHTEDTPLHLAFSCHVMNGDGEILVTRRALSKSTWPGVWTNSFCGHPQPDESSADAVHRRAEYELGLEISDLELVLPDFRYRAVDASGLVENEVCPVYVAHTVSNPVPNPLEVMDTVWVAPGALGRALDLTPWAFSPWLVLQSADLAMLDVPRESRDR